MRVIVVTSVVFLVGLVIVSERSAQAANPNYSYHVKIEDPVEGNYQEKAETRKGEYAEGFYSVVQPDGALRTVKYTADPDGFHPEVTYTYGHPVPPVKKVLVAGVQGQAIAHNVPSVSYQQIYSQAPAAVVPLGGGSGGYHSYVNTGNQYAATYGTPVFSVKESRQFIKSPAHAQAATAVLTSPHVLDAPGGYSYTAPKQPLQYHVETTQQVAQPVVIAQPPKVEYSQPAVHVVQTPVQTLVHQNAQFHAEVQKIHDVQYVQQAPVVQQQIQYAPAHPPAIVHQYINRAPVKHIKYVQPQPQAVEYLPPVVQKEVVQAAPPPVQYLPPAEVEVVKPAPPPVTYLPPPPAKVEPPSIKYLPPPTQVLVEKQPAPPSVTYLPPQKVVVEKPQVVHQQVQYVQPQVQYAQQVQYHQPQYQYFQQAASPVIHKQVQQQYQYFQQAPAPVIHKQVQQYIQPQIQQYVQPQVKYFQESYVEPARVEYEQVQYVHDGHAPAVRHEVHYAPAPVPAPAPVVQAVAPVPVVQEVAPAPVVQAVSPSPASVVHYAPQHLAYEPAQPTVIHHNHQQLLAQPRPQVVRKYEDIVVQNLDVMRYGAAPVHQYLAPPTGAKLRPKLVTQLQTAALATPVNGKQNPLTFNYGYDSGVSKVSHSYFGSGW